MSKHLGTLTLDLVANVGRYLEPLDKAERQTKKSTQSMQYHIKATGQAATEFEKVAKAATSLETTLKGLMVVGGGFISNNMLQMTVQAADTYTQLENKLKLVTDGQKELATAMNDSYEIAQRTASTWQGVNEIYAKFAGVAKDYKLSQQQVAQITETVAQAIGMSGASAAAADAALMQFGQALNTGVLRGAELNSVMSQTPALAKAIADGMGISVGELKKYGEQGKITTEEMIKALQKVAPEVAQAFAQTDTTISESVNRVKNEFTRMIGEFDNVFGVSNKAVSGITLLSENMDTLAAVLGAVATAMVSRYVGALATSTVAGYQQIQQLREKYVQQRINIEQEIRESQAKIANAQATLVALNAEKALEVERLKAQINQAGRIATATRMAELKRIETQVTAELAAANNALATAQGKVVTTTTLLGNTGRWLIGGLGGTAGLTITLAMVASGFLMMKKSTDDTTQSLNLQHKTVEQLTEEYKKLSLTQRYIELQKQQQSFNELTQSVNQARDGLQTYLRVLAISNQTNIEAQTEIRQLLDLYQQKKISTDELATRVRQLDGVDTQFKDTINQQSVALAEKENKLGQVKSLVDALSDKTEKNTQINLENAQSIQQQANAFEQLSEKQQNALSKLQQDMHKLQYINSNIAAGATPEKAQFFANYRERAELGYEKPLTPQELEILNQSWRIQEKNRVMVSNRQATNKKYSKANSSMNKSIPSLEVNNRVLENAKRYNFAGKEQRYNLPAGTLSAIHMIESKGNPQAYNAKTKAAGGFQFIPGTAKHWKLDNPYDMEQASEKAAQYLSYLFKLFNGNTEKAIRAYHAGEGNVQRGTGMGKYNNDYWKKYQAHMAWLDGKDSYTPTKNSHHSVNKYMADLERDRQEQQKKAEELANQRQQVVYDNMSPVQKILHDKQKKIEHLATLNLDYETQFKPYLEKIERNAQKEIELYEYTQQRKLAKYTDFLKTERQLLDEREKEEIIHVQTSKELTDDEIQQAIGLIKYRYDYERQRMNEKEQERVEQVGDMILNINDIAPKLLDMKAQKSMNPLQYQRWKLQNQMSEDGINAYARYNQAKDEVNKKDEQGFFVITDEQKRHQMLQDAEREHQQALLDIREQYRMLNKDLDEQEFETKMNMYNSMLGQAGQVWGTMTQMVKDSAGENSRAYKAMFFIQQGIAIGQAIINTELAATKALAEGGYIMGIPAATMVRAMGYASVGLIASQTISGMAHNGIDKLPADGTWNLQKGERVVSSKHNQDLTRFLDRQNRYDHQSQQAVNIVIHVNSNGADIQGSQSQDQHTLAVKLGQAIRKVIQQEHRQAGMFDK